MTKSKIVVMCVAVLCLVVTLTLSTYTWFKNSNALYTQESPLTSVETVSVRISNIESYNPDEFQYGGQTGTTPLGTDDEPFILSREVFVAFNTLNNNTDYCISLDFQNVQIYREVYPSSYAISYVAYDSSNKMFQNYIAITAEFDGTSYAAKKNVSIEDENKILYTMKDNGAYIVKNGHFVVYDSAADGSAIQRYSLGYVINAEGDYVLTGGGYAVYDLSNPAHTGLTRYNLQYVDDDNGNIVYVGGAYISYDVNNIDHSVLQRYSYGHIRSDTGEFVKIGDSYVAYDASNPEHAEAARYTMGYYADNETGTYVFGGGRYETYMPENPAHEGLTRYVMNIEVSDTGSYVYIENTYQEYDESNPDHAMLDRYATGYVLNAEGTHVYYCGNYVEYNSSKHGTSIQRYEYGIEVPEIADENILECFTWRLRVRTYGETCNYVYDEALGGYVEYSSYYGAHAVMYEKSTNKESKYVLVDGVYKLYDPDFEYEETPTEFFSFTKEGYNTYYPNSRGIACLRDNYNMETGEDGDKVFVRHDDTYTCILDLVYLGETNMKIWETGDYENVEPFRFSDYDYMRYTFHVFMNIGIYSVVTGESIFETV